MSKDQHTAQTAAARPRADSGEDSGLPRVSVVIPVRNEEKHLRRCLDSIQRQDYPHELMEILIVDGCSEDDTDRIAASFRNESDIEVRILENPEGNTPCGLNTGYKNARGDIFIHFIGHAMMPPHFISKDVELLAETGSDAVGGLVVSSCLENKTVPRGIGYALNTPFGLGGVTARTGTKARYIDNPSFGAYRKELFEKHGYIDERLTRNQDYEFNQRIVEAGAKIYFTPEIKSFYFNRPSYGSLWKEYFNAAKWRTFMIGRFARAVRMRHLVPPLFLLSLLGLGIGSFFSPLVAGLFAALLTVYLAAGVISASRVCAEKGWRFFPSMLFSYPVIHLAYGAGFIWGLLYFQLLGRGKQVNRAEAQ